jgi:hypothetical protein
VNYAWTYVWPICIAAAFVSVAIVSFVWSRSKRIEREEAAQRKRDLAEILARKDRENTRP